MAHVQITAGPGETKLLVDGVDITESVLAEGFGIDFSKVPAGPVVVSMKLRTDRLDLDLPDSIIDALAGDRSTTSEED